MNGIIRINKAENVTLNLSKYHHGKCHFQDWKDQQMGEQGNLLQKFPQGSLEGASRLSRTTQKPGVKSKQKSHRKTGMTNYGKIKKISTFAENFSTLLIWSAKGKKIQLKNEENCVDKKIGGNWEIRRGKKPKFLSCFPTYPVFRLRFALWILKISPRLWKYGRIVQAQNLSMKFKDTSFSSFQFITIFCEGLNNIDIMYFTHPSPRLIYV